MNTEQNFLVRYGLHTFVACTQKSGKNIFFFTRTESLSMICHAKALINEAFGEIIEFQPI